MKATARKRYRVAEATLRWRVEEEDIAFPDCWCCCCCPRRFSPLINAPTSSPPSSPREIETGNASRRLSSSSPESSAGRPRSKHATPSIYCLRTRFELKAMLLPEASWEASESKAHPASAYFHCIPLLVSCGRMAGVLLPEVEGLLGTELSVRDR